MKYNIDINELTIEEILMLPIGEIAILRFLRTNNINGICQKTYEDLRSKKNHMLRFDFYLPEYNTCVEFDEKEHFNDDDKYFNENDLIKNQYCFYKKINLVRIRYDEIYRINEFLLKFKNIEKSEQQIENKIEQRKTYDYSKILEICDRVKDKIEKDNLELISINIKKPSVFDCIE